MQVPSTYVGKKEEGMSYQVQVTQTSEVELCVDGLKENFVEINQKIDSSFNTTFEKIIFETRFLVLLRVFLGQS